MKEHIVRTYPSKEPLPKEEQFAWKMAQVGSQPFTTDSKTHEMVGNRIIDNAAVAIAAINRGPVQSARLQALAHPRKEGASLFGLQTDQTFECEWASWANNVAVRELDMHDTFLAADYSHPGDNIPALLAVAQQKGVNGSDFASGIIAAYEIHINLVKGICLHEHKKDHIAHLAPAIVVGLGQMLYLETDIIFHAIGQALHLSFSTRQSRKGEISSWKAYAPAFAGKLAIEAVDRAMRGEKSPTPIYEGEDSVIAWMLSGKNQEYKVELPERGNEYRAMLESYTKEHSAEYQAQSLIDIGIKLHNQNLKLTDIKEIVIHTSHHTHYVIGTGSNDPQKFDPKASRETLDHSAMYILAVAIEDGAWHHEHSYTPERAGRRSTVDLWKTIRTVEEKEWTEGYHATDPSKKMFGAEVEVIMNDGSIIRERLKNARAHASGERPFGRKEYVHKFTTLTEGLVDAEEQERFLKLVDEFEDDMGPDDVRELNVVLKNGLLEGNKRNKEGIF